MEYKQLTLIAVPELDCYWCEETMQYVRIAPAAIHLTRKSEQDRLLQWNEWARKCMEK